MDIFLLNVAVIDLVRNIWRNLKVRQSFFFFSFYKIVLFKAVVSYIGFSERKNYGYSLVFDTYLSVPQALEDRPLCCLCGVWSIFPEWGICRCGLGHAYWHRWCLSPSLLFFFLFFFFSLFNLNTFHWV